MFTVTTIHSKMPLLHFYIQNMDPLESVRENFVINFLATQIQAQEVSMKLLRRSSAHGHFWTRNLAENAMCLLKNN
jgi:hypothetical protein